MMRPHDEDFGMQHSSSHKGNYIISQIVKRTSAKAKVLLDDMAVFKTWLKENTWSFALVNRQLGYEVWNTHIPTS
jgi:hypothetical protein